MRRSRVVAVRLPAGRLHIAIPFGRGYMAACHRVVRGRDLVVHDARHADRAWALEMICRDCDRLKKRGTRELLRAAKW